MKYINKLALGAALAVASVAARAEGGPLAELTAAATQAKSDIGNAGGIIIGVVCAIAVVMWLRRVIK